MIDQVLQQAVNELGDKYKSMLLENKNWQQAAENKSVDIFTEVLNALKISKQDAEKQKSEYEKILGNMKSEFDSYQKMSEKLYSNLVEHTKHQEEAYDFKLKDLSTQFKQETDELKNFKKDKFLMSGGDNLTEVK